MSSIAVFLLIGGATAYAALGKNTVGSSQLKRNAVTSAKIKQEAVTAAKLKRKAVVSAALADGAVGGTKIVDGAVTNSKIANGAVTADKIAAGTLPTISNGGGALIPRGYAWVDAAGEVKPGFTENIPNAGHPSGGEYCYTLGFEPKTALVTIQGDAEPNDIGSVIIPATDASLVGCPPGTNLEVQVLNTPDETLNDE